MAVVYIQPGKRLLQFSSIYLVTAIIFLSLPRPLNTEDVLTKVRHNCNTCINTVELYIIYNSKAI